MREMKENTQLRSNPNKTKEMKKKKRKFYHAFVVQNKNAKD